MGDVGYCSPKLVNVCEELHDDEVDLGDEWRDDWHMDDPGLDGDEETEAIVRKKRRRERIQVKARVVQDHPILLGLRVHNKI